MTETLFTSDGKDVKLDMAGSEGIIDVEKFERTYNVVPGKAYKIKDGYGAGMHNYIYLGSGWSLCACEQSMYISPSHWPHWYTISTRSISDETIQMSIAYVRTRFGVNDGYEIDA